MLITAAGPITINPAVYSKLPYDPIKDVPAVTMLIDYPLLFVAHPSLAATSVKDLIAQAKAHPGKLRYAHPGVGTSPQLAVELFKLIAGVDITGLPYKGGGPAMVRVVSNESQLSFATPPSSLPHVKSGRVRAIAVTTAKRSAALPDIPTFLESGVKGYDVDDWVGMFVPAGTPPQIIARLHAETAKVLQMQEVKDQVLAGGSTVSGIPTEAMRKKVRDEIAMWTKVVKATGIKVD